MDKFLYYNELYGTYKELLTKKEQEIFSLYYEENNSMGEIAELKNITRSAVGNTIKIVEKKLEKYESVLKNVAFRSQLMSILNACEDQKTKELLEKLIQEGCE